jgi:hypothetical protein
MARQLLDPLRTHPDWDELTVGAAGLAGRVLAPEAGDPANAGDAMHAAVRGLVWLASNLSERGPAVFAVDDVHWADAPSLRWLALLARSLDELPIGVLCAVRSGEPAAAPGLLASAPEPPVRPRALGLLEDGPGLVLVHPLIAGTLYVSLPVGERAQWHAAAAALLADERVGPERIGLHLLRTEPAREAATVATLREAAGRARYATPRRTPGWRSSTSFL